MLENRKNYFEENLKPKLVYIGTLGAVLMAIAYVVCVLVMIFGFKVHNTLQSIVFSVVNGVVGLIIMQLLKIQGIDFAKNLETNKQLTDKFHLLQAEASKKKKKQKFHTLGYYWFVSVTKDVIFKGVSIIFASAGIIYIVIEGTNDYSLLLLAIVNLLMFICFGFLSLCQAYDFYNDKYIPYVKTQIEEQSKTTKNNTNKIEENKEDVDLQQSRIQESGRTSTVE